MHENSCGSETRSLQLRHPLDALLLTDFVLYLQDEQGDLATVVGTLAHASAGHGVDVARSGEDQTVLALREGPVITELRRFHLADTMQTTGRVAGRRKSS